MSTRYHWLAVASAAAIAAAALSALPARAQDDRAITIVLPEQPDNLEPCHSTRSTLGRIVKQNVNETLTEINPEDGSVKPRLAVSWEEIDPSTWRFKLREGVKFHDGADFDADAVVFNFERLFNDAIACEARNKYFGGITLETTAIDPLTVEFKANRPLPIFPTLLGTVTLVSPNTPIDQATREPIGTGPYRLAEWEPSERVVLERVDDYWGEQPEVEKATYVWRSESAVRAAMVETGEADIAASIAAQDATDEQTDFAYFDSETTRFRIDQAYPPLDDVRVRMALNYAIDREALRGSVFPEDAVAASQYVVPGINGFNPDLEPYPYDPEKARQLLAEAAADGVPVDAEIRIIGRLNIHPNATEAAEAVMAMLQEVGFNINLTMIEVGDWVRYLEKPFPENIGPNLLQEMHDNNNGDATFTVYNKYHSNGPNSTMGDPEIDALIETADAATGDLRRDTYQEVLRKLHEEIAADMALFHMVGFTRVGPRLDWRPSISTNSEIQLSTMKFN